MSKQTALLEPGEGRHKSLTAIRLIFLLVALLAVGHGLGSSLALAGSRADAAEAAVEAKILRVGGDYIVKSIDKTDAGSFVIKFNSVQPTGKFDTLVLESDHVHVAIRVGQKLRLSAEIMGQRASGKIAEVSQVVLFLPSNEGHIPVWLLSNKAPARDLRGSRYLEMHSPTSDYTIM